MELAVAKLEVNKKVSQHKRCKIMRFMDCL
jgi:hypothetical protein